MAKARRKTKVTPGRRRKTRLKRPQAHGGAIVRVAVPATRPWELKSEEVELVKNTVCKGATDAELAFCLATARRYKLDPFRGQIWFVPRRDGAAPSGKRWIPIVGINGLLHLAARDHRDFGTNDEPQFGPNHTVKYRKNGEGPEHELEAPEWARITIWKKRHDHPAVATVYWDEIYQNIDYSPLVRQMPKLMLAKCALAQAIRRAYPATDGLYIREEFQDRPQFTSEGRAIEYTEAQPALEVPPIESDPHVENYLSRLTPAERAAEEAAMKRDSQKERSVRSADKAAAGASGTRTETPATAPRGSVVFIIAYPEKPEGDVTVTCAPDVIALLELKRTPEKLKEGDENHRLVKHSALPMFYDRAREKGVEVRDLTKHV